MFQVYISTFKFTNYLHFCKNPNRAKTEKQQNEEQYHI